MRKKLTGTDVEALVEIDLIIGEIIIGEIVDDVIVVVVVIVDRDERRDMTNIGVAGEDLNKFAEAYFAEYLREEVGNVVLRVTIENAAEIGRAEFAHI